VEVLLIHGRSLILSNLLRRLSWASGIDDRFDDSLRGFGNDYGVSRNDDDVGFENDVSGIETSRAVRC
jgi:hypothetical protein